MIQLAIWIVSFIIVAWAIITIGIPLLILGTSVAISFRRVISGVFGIIFILLASGLYDSSPQFSVFLTFLGIVMVIYAFGKEEKKQSVESSQETQLQHLKITHDTDNGYKDAMYSKAVKIVIESKAASAGLLQKELQVGYARAARLIEQMEEHKVIGPEDDSKSRKVLIKNIDEI